MQFACYEWGHLDSMCCNHLLQRPGNGTAHERVDAKLRQTKRPLNRQGIHQDLLCLSDNSPRLDLDEPYLSRRIEHRCDSAVPLCKCYFCHPKLHALF